MSSSTQAPQKKSRGRQKIEMVKMENENNLQVTFSKRRAGVFKKASEICTLCAAEASIVVFSPANKVYCFGHPSVESVVNRFLNGFPPEKTTNFNQLILEAQRNSTIRNLNLELTQLETLLAMEKRRAEELDKVRKNGQMQQWYPNSLDEFNFAQLRCLKEAVLELKKNFNAEVEKGMLKLSNPHLFHPLAGENHENGNPSGFSFDAGTNICGNNVPTFDTQMMNGSNDFSSYANYNSSGFGAQMPNYGPITNFPLNAPFSYIEPTFGLSSHVDEYGLVTNGSNGAVFMAGGNSDGSGPSSSVHPISTITVANGGFSASGGFNDNGYGYPLI